MKIELVLSLSALLISLVLAISRLRERYQTTRMIDDYNAERFSECHLGRFDRDENSVVFTGEFSDIQGEDVVYADRLLDMSVCGPVPFFTVEDATVYHVNHHMETNRYGRQVTIMYYNKP